MSPTWEPPTLLWGRAFSLMSLRFNLSSPVRRTRWAERKSLFHSIYFRFPFSVAPLLLEVRSLNVSLKLWRSPPSLRSTRCSLVLALLPRRKLSWPLERSLPTVSWSAWSVDLESASRSSSVAWLCLLTASSSNRPSDAPSRLDSTLPRFSSCASVSPPLELGISLLSALEFRSLKKILYSLYICVHNEFTYFSSSFWLFTGDFICCRP